MKTVLCAGARLGPFRTIVTPRLKTASVQSHLLILRLNLWAQKDLR